MLAASRPSLLSSKRMRDAALVLHFIGGATLVFSMTEHLAEMGDSTENLILTSMIGGGIVVWTAVKAERAKPQPKSRASDDRYAALERICYRTSWVLLLILVAVTLRALPASSSGDPGTHATAWPHNQILTPIAGIFIVTAYMLRWTLELRSQE